MNIDAPFYTENKSDIAFGGITFFAAVRFCRKGKFTLAQLRSCKDG